MLRRVDPDATPRAGLVFDWAAPRVHALWQPLLVLNLYQNAVVQLWARYVVEPGRRVDVLFDHASSAAGTASPRRRLSLSDMSEVFHYTCCITNSASGNVPARECRHRSHAPVRDRVRNWKDRGLKKLGETSSAVPRPDNS